MDHVAELLKKQNIKFFEKGEDYVIRCLNPEHEDRNPSTRVNKISGLMHCFSCGYGGSLFKHFGILTDFTSIKTAKLREKLKNLEVSFNGVEFPVNTTPYNKPFRGISVDTLKKFGAFYTIDKEEFADRIWFPITDTRDKPVVFVGRHTHSNGNPRYMNYPRHIKIPVFPPVVTKNTSSIVLVEGIFDFLNLYDKGMHNVVCTFGTSTLQKDVGLKLLPFRVVGVKKIYLMFDGDDAGRKAMDELKPLIEEQGFVVEIISLEDGTDPGEFTQEYVDSIKEYTSNEENSNYRQST